MDANKLLEITVAELERILTVKSVVGEPLKIDGTTIVPLISIGIGFGVGGGEATAGKAPGQGAGVGGGGGVKPVAALIIDQHGARLESIKGTASFLAQIAGSVGELARARLDGDDKKRLATTSPETRKLES